MEMGSKNALAIMDDGDLDLVAGGLDQAMLFENLSK